MIHDMQIRSRNFSMVMHPGTEPDISGKIFKGEFGKYCTRRIKSLQYREKSCKNENKIKKFYSAIFFIGEFLSCAYHQS